ncbi:23S rRNA (guanosine(2251)-2'-O)-methyltransferase RlmB [Lichenihabitans psoromatis]|uniref:23S rRNA (guanosine(2251)-2'-O)-methyltransferase RlmB n=1 Tax=Lichenihabitans psoromatis TaxID=2528642 RepID=UPI001FE02C29|nr:23S rRNA (guanosine(2251)-2'-O)-methyltransferase RlmB [Lichenihabitans psoromatis]
MKRPRQPPTSPPSMTAPGAGRPGRERDHSAPHRASPLSGSYKTATARLRATPELTLIWGFHAAQEALRSESRKILRVSATEAAAERLAPELEARGITPEIFTGADLDAKMPRDAVHQGVVVEARPLADLDISDVPDTGTLLVLDQITDPHNVGAIMRTAAAFDVAAMITTERHAPDMTGVLAKSASGGLEHVPVVHVVNLARALDSLAKRGFQIVGLDSEGTQPLEHVEPSSSLVLVLGAEGKGLRRLTRERCEVVARLDMPGAIKSLNVSNACAVALATLRLRRPAS